MTVDLKKNTEELNRFRNLFILRLGRRGSEVHVYVSAYLQNDNH